MPDIGVKVFLKNLMKESFIYEKYKKDLLKSYSFTIEEINNFNLMKLRKILIHCGRNVPYYKELFKKINFNPEIKYINEIEKIPFLDKKMLKGNYDKFISKRPIDRLFKNTVATSGSTGTPIKLVRNLKSVNFENAVLNRFWENSLIDSTNYKWAILRGEQVVSKTQNKAPYWKYVNGGRHLVMSSYHLSNSTAYEFLKNLKKFDPDVLYAYPSTAYLLALYLIRHNLDLNIKVVYTSSEMLLNKQKDVIEEVFKSKVYDWYGQSERVAAICNCNMGNYHIVEDYSYVELVDTGYGKEIVGTHTDNFIMPLIRYRTGDIVESDKTKCDCGSDFRLVSDIKGREFDYIVTEDGSRIPYTIMAFSFYNIENIYESQFNQLNFNNLIINVVVNDKYNKNDEKKLIDKVKNLLDNKLSVKVNVVDEIKRGSNGKFKPVISFLTKNKRFEEI